MSEVSISKALNLKNKLAGRLAHVANLIASHNSHVEGTKQHFDVKELLKEYTDKSARIAAVKAAIAKGNADAGVFPLIYEMAELKSRISYLRAVNTREGAEEYSGGYNQPNKTRNWVVSYDQSSIEKMVQEAEDRLEELQDKITYLNQMTKVSIPD
jgi:hypothetical protein